MSGTIDLNLITAFVAVAEAGSFTAAAARLAQPKSSLSRWVAQLERDLGEPLFERSTRRLRLTDGGEALYAKVAPLVRELHDSGDWLRARRDALEGTVRVAAPVEFGVYVLAPCFARFMEVYPRIDLEVDLSSRWVDLADEGFDVAFRVAVRPLPDLDLVARPLMTMSRHVFAAPSLLDRHGLPDEPQDLTRYPCLIAHDEVHWDFTRADGHAESVPLRSRLRANSLSFVREGVYAGVGLGILSTTIAGEGYARGDIRMLLPDWQLAAARAYALTPPRVHRSAKVTCLVDFVERWLKQANPLLPLNAAPSPR